MVVYVWIVYGCCSRKGLGSKKKKNNLAKRYSGGSEGVSPSAERWQEPIPLSGRGFMWLCLDGDATEKGWVVKRKKKTCREVFHPAKEVCRGGSGGVFPAGRWQEPNPFSSRGFIVVVVYGGVWTVYGWCMDVATEKD